MSSPSMFVVNCAKAFNLASVVVRAPVAGEFLEPGQLNALRLIRDRFPIGPTRRRDAPAKVDQLLLRHIDVEGANLDGGFDGGAHDDLLAKAVSPLLVRAPINAVTGMRHAPRP